MSIVVFGATRRTVLALIGTMVLVGPLLSACGDDEDVPTVDALIDRVVTADELGPRWESPPEMAPRMIVDDDRAELATLDLCTDATAEAREAASGLRWQVGGGAEFTTDDAAFRPALVVLLSADEPDHLRDTFEILRGAMTSCLPTEVSIADAGDFSVTELIVPAVGDDRFGVRRQQTDQAPGSDRWDQRDVLVLDGTVLMWFSEIEINPDTDLVVDRQAFDDALVAAAARLAGDASSSGADTTADDVGLANPASVYCVEQGGVVEIVDEADGQVGYCLLPDGRRIEEWEYFWSASTTVP